MTEREVARFLGTIERAGHSLSSRDHALFATLAYTGIRLSDAVSLRRRDIRLRERRLTLERAKGNRREERRMPGCLARILSRFLADRPAGAGDEPVFIGRGGGALSARLVQYRFAYWRRRANIRKPLSVHSLRHTFGTLLYRRTRDLVLVSRAMGHRDLNTTQRYAHIEDYRILKAVNELW